MKRSFPVANRRRANRLRRQPTVSHCCCGGARSRDRTPGPPTGPPRPPIGRSALRRRAISAREPAPSLWCPRGYIAVDQLSAWLRYWFEAGQISPDSPFANLTIAAIEDRVITMTLFGSRLVSGTLRSVGIVTTTGRIVPLRASDWRRAVRSGDRLVQTTASAWNGKEICVSSPTGSIELCRPAVLASDLAEVVGHTDPPPMPVELPRGWEISAAANVALPPTDAEARLKIWMKGYAQGFKAAKGAVIKRDDAIAAAVAIMACTTRQAEAAYEALAHPSLRNAPRITKD